MNIRIILIYAGMLLFSCQNDNEIIYTSPDYPVEERVDDILRRMNIDEKVAQLRIFHARLGIEPDDAGNIDLSEDVIARLGNGIGGIKNPGEHLTPEKAAKLNNQLQKYIIDNNRLGIPALFITESYNGVDAYGCTRSPRPITLSSSWNTELVKKVYDLTGREARLRGLHMTHSPVADIARDPRFGRMSESFGEDSYLTTEMIVNAVKGLQGEYTGLNSTHIGAVTKHFAGYAQVTGGKNFASVQISPRTLYDEIMSPFKAAVVEANTLGIMAAHNDLNGIACHGNKDLLTDVLRDQWGFEGYVVSDANDIERLHTFMKVADSPEDAAIMGLQAGMDLDLYSDNCYALLPGIAEVNPELIQYIDRSVRRVLRTKFILGLFDNPYSDPIEAATITRNETAVELAMKADEESIILLKNENSLLPVTESKAMTIALVGPVLSESTLSSFHKVAPSNHRFITEKGYDLTDGNPSVPELTEESAIDLGIQKILQKTRNADLVILYAGGDEYTSKEAFFNGGIGDRENLDPVCKQDQLITEIKKTGKPVIVVLKHRRTLSFNTIAEKADAIIDCWELSEFGDAAIAKTIYGAVNPSGKLSVTVPRSVGQLPVYYSQKSINYKKGYLFAKNSPLYPFGFGLSYTEFEYSNLTLSDSILENMNDSLKISIDVSNTGEFAGSEVVQLYLKDMYASVLRPDKELKAFKKIHLNTEETKKVSFLITPEMLEFTGLEMNRVIEPGTHLVMIGGSSADLLSASFKLKKKVNE